MTTTVIFACFVVAAFTRLFSKIEARFYEPAKIADIRKQLDSVAEYGDTYINTLLEQFSTGENAYLSDTSVASYALSSPSDSDVQRRTRRTAALFSEAGGLDGIRLVDANGRSVHFSTYPSDILKQTDSMRIYKNYNELHTPLGKSEFAFFKFSVTDTDDGQKYRIVFDGEGNRILFAFPFYDPYRIYRGTIVFYVNAQDFNRTLIARNLTTVANTSDLISDSSGAVGGFVFGMPSLGRDDIEREAIACWCNNSSGPDKIASIPESGDTSKESYWILISSSRSRFIKAAGVYRDSIFIMPHTVQFLLLTCVFITLFLTIFMLFNLRRDDMVVIRDRVKRFQLALINEYFENKENINWADVSEKIASRKGEVSEAIKESLGKRAKRHSAETDALIEKSWDEIIGALNVKTKASEASALQDSKEIRRMLEEILRSGVIQTQYNAAAEKSVNEEPKEISLGRESIETDGLFETNTEPVNAAAKTEEAFFENENGSESHEESGRGKPADIENLSDEKAYKTSEREYMNTASAEVCDKKNLENEKIDACGEILMGAESATSDDWFGENTELVNAATEAEEIFFNNFIAAESVKKIFFDEPSDKPAQIAYGEVRMGAERAPSDDWFNGNIELVNAATEAEEIFFDNSIASEAGKKILFDEPSDEPAETAHGEISPIEKDAASGNTAAEIVAENEVSDSFAENSGDAIHSDESASSAADGLVQDESLRSDSAPKSDSSETADSGRDFFTVGDAQAESRFSEKATEAVPFAGSGASDKDVSVATAVFEASAKTDDVSSATEDVDIDLFMNESGAAPSSEDDIFAEPLQLGEPKNEHRAKEEVKPIDFNVVSAPNFLFLDEERKESGRSPKQEDGAFIAAPSVAEESAADRRGGNGGDDDAEDIQPFENEKSAVPFSFTSFASHEEKIQNLPPASENVILEGGDGVFSIASGIDFDGVVQDEAFKRLVDSVIN